MEYRVEPGDEGLRLDLDDVDDFASLDEAHVQVVGGEVSVAGTSSPPRLEVDGVTDAPVAVRLRDGVLTVEQPSEWSPRLRRLRATVTLTVPPAASVWVRTESGAVVAAGLAGQMSFATVSGEVTGTCLSGDVTARTVSGEVALDGVAGRLRAESVSGPITVVGGLLQELALSSVSGEVVVDLDPRPGARCSCRTASGPVTVRLPGDASIAFEAESLSGQVEVPEWADTFEQEVPPWGRTVPGPSRAWAGRAGDWAGWAGEWAGRAGQWAGRAGEWADAMVDMGTMLSGEGPGSWARTCFHIGGLGRMVRGRLGGGDATLKMASVLGDISMVCRQPSEAVA